MSVPQGGSKAGTGVDEQSKVQQEQPRTNSQAYSNSGGTGGTTNSYGAYATNINTGYSSTGGNTMTQTSNTGTKPLFGTTSSNSRYQQQQQGGSEVIYADLYQELNQRGRHKILRESLSPAMWPHVLAKHEGGGYGKFKNAMLFYYLREKGVEFLLHCQSQDKKEAV